MPCRFLSRLPVIYWCRRRVPWSFHRGPCRFTAGHAGDCKPGKRVRPRVLA